MKKAGKLFSIAKFTANVITFMVAFNTSSMTKRPKESLQYYFFSGYVDHRQPCQEEADFESSIIGLAQKICQRRRRKKVKAKEMAMTVVHTGSNGVSTLGKRKSFFWRIDFLAQKAGKP